MKKRSLAAAVAASAIATMTVAGPAFADAGAVSPAAGPTSGGQRVTISTPTDTARGWKQAVTDGKQVWGLDSSGHIWVASYGSPDAIPVPGDAASVTFDRLVDAHTYAGTSNFALAIDTAGAVWTLDGPVHAKSAPIRGVASAGVTDVTTDGQNVYGLDRDGRLWSASEKDPVAAYVTGDVAQVRFHSLSAGTYASGGNQAVGIDASGTPWIIQGQNRKSEAQPVTGDLAAGSTAVATDGLYVWGIGADGTGWAASRDKREAQPLTGAGKDVALTTVQADTYEGAGNQAVALASDGTSWVLQGLNRSASTVKVGGGLAASSTQVVTDGLWVYGIGSDGRAWNAEYKGDNTTATAVTGPAATSTFQSLNSGTFKGGGNQAVGVDGSGVTQMLRAGGSVSVTGSAITIDEVVFGSNPGTNLEQSDGSVAVDAPAGDEGTTDITIRRSQNGTALPDVVIPQSYEYQATHDLDTPLVDMGVLGLTAAAGLSVSLAVAVGRRVRRAVSR